MANGSWEMSFAGSSDANLLAAVSSVLRLTWISRPSSSRLAEGPLTLSVVFVTAIVMPSSLSSVFRAETGSDPSGLPEGAWMPAAVMETCWPAIDTFCTWVDPVTVPLVPSDEASAVDVMLPMEMKPPSMEMPPTVALASAVALVDGACDDELADSPPTPRSAFEPARRLPEPDGACWVGLAPLEPAVAASLPSVAVAVFPSVELWASMFNPGMSVEALLGFCGKSLTAWSGHVGAGGSGTPGTSSAS